MVANVFFFPDFLSKIFFIRQPEIIYDRMICSFTISLSYPRTHPLSSLSPSLYICSVTNHLKKLLTILSVCCYPMSAIYIFALKSVYF